MPEAVPQLPLPQVRGSASTAAATLHALAAEAENLLGAGAQETLRAVAGERHGGSAAVTRLVRMHSPVEQITELQHEAEALASPRAADATTARGPDAQFRAEAAQRQQQSALVEESVPPPMLTTTMPAAAAAAGFGKETQQPTAVWGPPTVAAAGESEWQPASSMAVDHIDTLSLHSGDSIRSTSSLRHRALEYMHTERRFLSNRGPDHGNRTSNLHHTMLCRVLKERLLVVAAMIEFYFSITKINRGISDWERQAQHPVDDDYLLQWRPVQQILTDQQIDPAVADGQAGEILLVSPHTQSHQSHSLILRDYVLRGWL